MSAPISHFSVLFVCMGNICRSPTAEAVMRRLTADRGLSDRITISSAGTHSFHIGAEPDARSRVHGEDRGYDLSPIRAKKLSIKHFAEFDLLLAMDWENFSILEIRAPESQVHKCKRLMEFGKRHSSPIVPDPYSGGPSDFETVIDLCEDACNGLLDHIEARLAQSKVS
jgi:protein-tyrosine phosphatase